MKLIEQMAQAALKRDSLQLRSLVQDWVRSDRLASELSRPQTKDARLLSISAALAELFYWQSVKDKARLPGHRKSAHFQNRFLCWRLPPR